MLGSSGIQLKENVRQICVLDEESHAQCLLENTIPFNNAW